MADGDAPWAKRPPISMILKLVATVVILALVFYSLDLDKLSGALSAIDWHWLVLGSAASALFVSLRIIKWRELTQTNGMSASGKEIARTALLGLAVGLITLVRLGELVGVAPFTRPDRGRAILSHGYDRLYELFAVLVFSLPAAFLLLGWAGRLVSVGIVALYGIGIAMAQSAYWRSKFGGFSLLRKVPKLDALPSTIIATSPVYWMLSITPHRLPPADVLHRRHRADPRLACRVHPTRGDTVEPDLHHHRRTGRARGIGRGTLAERGSCARGCRGGVLSVLLLDQADPRPQRAHMDRNEHEAPCAFDSR